MTRLLSQPNINQVKVTASWGITAGYPGYNDYWVLIKLGDFIGQNAQIWEILMKLGKFWLIFTKMRFSQIHTDTDFFNKNEASRKLKFGLEVPLYGF